MYEQIKKLADEAIGIQNKDKMDAALREISAMCVPVESQPVEPEKQDAPVAIKKDDEVTKGKKK